MTAIPSFVINLARDSVRRTHMREQLEKRGLSAEFIPAVDGRMLSAEDRTLYSREKALRIYGVEMMDTEIACALSHYRLYERIVRDDIDVALIMEDDIELSPQFPGIVRALAGDPAPEWLVVRLESMRPRVRAAESSKFAGKKIRAFPDGELYRLQTHVLGLGAYVIRKEGAQRMIDYARPIFMSSDQMMDRYWENGIIPYVVRPFPAYQRMDFENCTGARPSGRHRSQPSRVRWIRRGQRVLDGIRKRLFWLLHGR